MSYVKISSPQFINAPQGGPFADSGSGGGSGGSGPKVMDEIQFIDANRLVTQVVADRSNNNVLAYYTETDRLINISTDFGKTWIQRSGPADGPTNMTITCIHGPMIFMGGGLSPRQTYRSMDYGLTWTRLTTDMTQSIIIQNGQLIGVSLDYYGTASSVWISDDYGDTCTETLSNVYATYAMYVSGLKCILLGTPGNSSTDKIHRSEDFGKTFQSYSINSVIPEISYFVSTQHFTSGDTILLYDYTTKKLYTSEDFGLTWSAVPSMPVSVEHNAVRVRIYQSAFVVIWSRAGLVPKGFYSIDKGKTWFEFSMSDFTGTILCDSFNNFLTTFGANPATLQKLSFGTFVPSSASMPTGNQFYGVKNGIWSPSAQVPSTIEPGKVLVGSADRASFEWSEYVREETKDVTAMVSKPVLLKNTGQIRASGNRVVALSTANKTTFYSEDGGETWNPSESTWTSAPSEIQITKSCVFARNSASIYVSTDNGKTFVQKPNLSSWPSKAAWDLSQEDLCYYSWSKADTLEIYTSIDLGDTWSVRAINATYVRNVSTGGGISVSGKYCAYVYSGKTYLSDNYGDTWKIISESIFNIRIKDRVIVKAKEGIIKSSVDFGDTWNEFVVPDTNFSDISILNSGVLIVAYKTACYISRNFGRTWMLFDVLAPDSNAVSTGFFVGTDRGGVLYRNSQNNIYLGYLC